MSYCMINRVLYMKIVYNGIISTDVGFGRMGGGYDTDSDL